MTLVLSTACGETVPAAPDTVRNCLHCVNKVYSCNLSTSSAASGLVAALSGQPELLRVSVLAGNCT
jgi:hypothetical protein